MPIELNTNAPVPTSSQQLCIRKIDHPEWTEYFLTTSTLHCSPSEWLKIVDTFLSQHSATVVACDIYGPESLLLQIQSLTENLGKWDCPWSFLAGRFDTPSNEGGYLVHAISGIDIKPLHYGDRLIGSTFDDSTARHVFLSNLTATQTSSSVGDQTGEVLEMIELSLKSMGMNFRHVTRTWFYLDRILDWYPEFNRVRTEFFQAHDIFGGIMPASTGVGAANLSGSALLAKAHAVLPKSKDIQIQAVDSPLQCDAYKYGSAFSRALSIDDKASSSLFISGTASIEPGGKTVHIDDVENQIKLTMEVVDAILKSRSMSWEDTVRAIAYFRHADHIPLWNKLGESIPTIATQCDVCRDDLLFEIELQVAVRK